MTRLLYALIFLGMGINGALYLAWFLSLPNPDRIGYWYLIYFICFPFLGVLGIIALAQKKALNLSWWTGILLLFYVGILTLLMYSFSLGFGWILDWLPQDGFEIFHVVLFVVTLVSLFIVMKRR